MHIDSALAAVAVTDLEEARSFYQLVFGRPADQEPMPTLAQWDITAGGAVQVVVDAERSGRSMVTLLVVDLDATLSALRGAGIEPGEVIDGVISRVTQLEDPAGNVVTIAEIPTQGV